MPLPRRPAAAPQPIACPSLARPLLARPLLARLSLAGASIAAPVVLATVVLSTAVDAQTAAPATPASPPAAPAKHKPDPYGSPLDTIMSAHLWTDVPEAQDFVRDSRPAPKSLKYSPVTGPLTGKDPDRPKPRDKANIMALQAELEEDGARNAARARALQPAVKAKHARKRAAADQ